MTRERFERDFQAKNLPCVLTDIGSLGWRAAKEWVDQASGEADMEALRSKFGHHEVTVHGADGRREDMTLTDYIDWWQQNRGSGEWKYLKDWHLASQQPDYAAYSVPECLGADWLNEHWGATCSQSQGGDHRFVYIGPAGSFTALHADVLFSYSWSANVTGEKRWLLVPSEQRSLVSDEATRPLVRDLKDLPKSSKASTVTPIEIFQHAGELLFVPSGWYHQVENLTDCISINHNWLTAHNVGWALTRIKEVLADVQHGLSEGEDDDAELCESIVSRRCGMGVGELCDMLEGVIQRRTHTPQRSSKRVRRSADCSTAVSGTDSLEISRASEVLAEALNVLETVYANDTLDAARLAAIQKQKQMLRTKSMPA
jgi:hypothetical protein